MCDKRYDIFIFSCFHLPRSFFIWNLYHQYYHTSSTQIMQIYDRLLKTTRTPRQLNRKQLRNILNPKTNRDDVPEHRRSFSLTCLRDATRRDATRSRILHVFRCVLKVSYFSSHTASSSCPRDIKTRRSEKTRGERNLARESDGVHWQRLPTRSPARVLYTRAVSVQVRLEASPLHSHSCARSILWYAATDIHICATPTSFGRAVRIYVANERAIFQRVRAPRRVDFTQALFSSSSSILRTFGAIAGPWFPPEDKKNTWISCWPNVLELWYFAWS